VGKEIKFGNKEKENDEVRFDITAIGGVVQTAL